MALRSNSSSTVSRIDSNAIHETPSQKQTLVKVELHTGRKHQIRAQFAHIGHPLVGDSKYGASQTMKLRYYEHRYR